MANPFYTYSGAFIPGILARAEALTAEFQSVQSGFALLGIQGTDSGAANAYVVTTKGGQDGVYKDGLIVEFKAANANTGPCTIAVDSGAVVGLTNFSGQSLVGGAISANTWYRALYNSSYSAWTLIAPTSLVTTSNTIASAAPTNLVGLAAAGGVSTACTPIDATYALSQAIVPTWTGAHTFGSTVTFNSTVTFSGGLSLTGTAGQYAISLTGSSVSGQSLGELIKAGTNASDFCFRAQNQSGATDYFKILGEGSIVAGAATGGGKGVGTINAVNLYVNGAAVLTSAATSANPSATIGLSAVNGTAATFMTSDSAPPLSQAIAPTWTGAHIFSYTGASPITINSGVNRIGLTINGSTNTGNQYLMELISGTGSGFSSGLFIAAGTTSGDVALDVVNAAQTVNYFVVRGDGQTTLQTPNLTSEALIVTSSGNNTGPLATFNSGGATGSYIRYQTNGADVGYLGAGNRVFASTASDFAIGVVGAHSLYLGVNNTAILRLLGVTAPTIQGYGPTAGTLVDMTPDTGTFTITYTGFTAGQTGTARWARNGNMVMLILPVVTATSNATSFTATGLPSEIQPAHTQDIALGSCFINNGSVIAGVVTMTASSGTITFWPLANGQSWSNVNNKGITTSGNNIVIWYMLN